MSVCIQNSHNGGLQRTWARRFPLLALLATTGGLFAAGVLSVGHLLDLPVPCGASGGCATVANHPAAKLLGVPIAYFGVSAYAAILLLLTRLGEARGARLGLLALSGAGTAASAVLLYYSQTVIRATCPWCVASGVALAALFVTSILLLRVGHPIRSIRPAWALGLAMLTCGGVGVQAGLMQRAANAPPIPAERLAAVTAEDFVDPAKSRGAADAPVTIVLFTDLWCPACRAVHASLVDYQSRNPAAVRLAIRHRPLSQIRGHEQSAAAAALSEIAAEQGQFWPFIDALFAQPYPLDGDGYLRLLQSLDIAAPDAEARVGDRDDPAVRRVWEDIDLADRLEIDATPTFVVLLKGHPPVSANQRTLPRVLNSPPVLAKLSDAGRP